MRMIGCCMVIVMFITGVVFGFVIGKNGYVQIGLPDTTPQENEKEKSSRKTVEEQLEDMMNYDGNMKGNK